MMAECSSRRSCINDPNQFCYVCGEYILKENRRKITEFLADTYSDYFGINLGHQDKMWAPHMVCKMCTEHLRQFTNNTRRMMRFGTPMIWREPTNHYNDCYFCSVNLKGIGKKSRKVLYISIFTFSI